ncbi:peptidyl-tRNA hydrolase [Parvularcula bermudensis HTCC2503]|uniref:Peptidyl-tRNA hydrolase n=1 Tax=Parvularcula bermudensis (strain ATCC BAA-594 / HTCC2503 / KCTC 12087) TaxID=314260 RepID=E0TD91_PARBH|nr:aminoacyl-tRNA hydrolase [Parvularcula bermudensis]ADM09914.1 peptidyl-tRNA hydrolase [Parvularcula bermudensis HTCC2503]
MILLIGLGNPGAQYAQNRHNAGFHAVEEIHGAHDFGPERSKFRGALAEGRVGSCRAFTLRPDTYYNDSGTAVLAASQFYKIPLDDIIVFHDEIDLAPGKVRVKKGGGLAGNNGLRSIAAHLGPDFWRVRIGIGHPGHKDKVMPYVLGNFSKAERTDYYDDLLERMARSLPLLMPRDEAAVGRFQSAVMQPPAAPKPREGDDPPPAATPPTSRNRPSAPASPFDALKSLKGD